jgi:hypothetical protein
MELGTTDSELQLCGRIGRGGTSSGSLEGGDFCILLRVAVASSNFSRTYAYNIDRGRGSSTKACNDDKVSESPPLLNSRSREKIVRVRDFSSEKQKLRSCKYEAVQTTLSILHLYLPPPTHTLSL